MNFASRIGWTPFAPAFRIPLTVVALLALAATVVWATVGMGYFWPMWVWSDSRPGPCPCCSAIRWSWALAPGPRRRLDDPGMHLVLVGGDRSWSVWAMTGGGLLLAGVRAGRRSAGARGARRRSAAPRQTGPQRPRRRAHPHPPRRAGRPGGRAAPDRARPARRRAGPAGRADACSSGAPRSAWRTTPRRRSWCATPAWRPPRRSPSCATWRAASPRRCWPTAASRPPWRRSASARRSPVDGRRAGSTRRLPPVVESAAYFVVAESLTNAAKHAPRRRGAGR